MKRLVLYLILLITLFAAGCDAPAAPSTPSGSGQASNDVLRVSYIDVGQGDATFIELPNGQTMLIDAGEAEYGDAVANYITKSRHDFLDYVVATHPHKDHIGGMAKVLDAVDVGAIYMPRIETTTQTFENLLAGIDAKGLKITPARAGMNVLSDADLSVDILAPNSEKYSELNNYSIVVMITYKNAKCLFMADAETLSENELRGDIRADVVKVGHHGSDSSSGQSFVDKVKARYAVISVGKGNSYDHPSPDIVERWGVAGTSVYRTDLDGTVVISSDGTDITVSCEKSSDDPIVETELDPASPVPASPVSEDPRTEKTGEWVLNTSTKKIHYPDCRSVPQIKEDNLTVSDKTVAELKNEGFGACGICKPHD